MDLSEIGSIIAGQLDAIEATDYPEGTTIPAALTAVIIQEPDGNSMVRCRISLPIDETKHEFSQFMIKSLIVQAIQEGWL